jgi:SAM-dependent methyltransferase
VHSPLVCIDCHSPLLFDGSLSCGACGATFRFDDRIADFARGDYYDTFDAERDRLTSEHLAGLKLELEGSVRRLKDFYIPLIRRVMPQATRVLDAGCGNGVSVDVLRAAGFDGWGNDLSQLRKHQWLERDSRENLVVASALRLPFPDHYFDVVISSGVVEHIGVEETGTPHYSVKPVSGQRELRLAYMRELGRVTAPQGHIFLDCPNGRFPVDFWHGNSPGSPRFHGFSEGFLPTFSELRSLAREALGTERVDALSPRDRLQFRQSARHFHGRVLRFPFAALFRLMQVRGFRWLARTALNPFLVVDIVKR